MKKKRRFFLPIILVSFYLIISNCSLEKLDRLTRMKNDFGLKWDLKLTVPVLEKRELLKDHIDEIKIDPYQSEVADIPLWPVDSTRDEVFSGKIPLDINIDFNDDNSNDLDIYGIRSEGSELLISVWLTDPSGNTILPIRERDITLSSASIEGITYGGELASSENGIIVFRIIGFPSPDNNYYLDFAGDAGNDKNNIDFESLSILLKPDNTILYPFLGIGTFYRLHVRTDFTLGDDYQIAARVIDDAELFKEEDTPLPVDNLPFNNIDRFTLKYSIESTFPFSINMNNHFSTENNLYTQDNIFTIASGRLQYSNLNGYYYVDRASNTSNDFSLDKTLLKQPNVTMDYAISINHTENPVLLTLDDYIKISASVVCEGTVDF